MENKKDLYLDFREEFLVEILNTVSRIDYEKIDLGNNNLISNNLNALDRFLFQMIFEIIDNRDFKEIPIIDISIIIALDDIRKEILNYIKGEFTKNNITCLKKGKMIFEKYMHENKK